MVELVELLEPPPLLHPATVNNPTTSIALAQLFTPVVRSIFHPCSLLEKTTRPFLL